MTDLSVKWAGLTLKSPVIVGACNLTINPQKAKEMEDAGAGAIVFKSLFEEQVQLENLQTERVMTQYDERDPEMISLHPKFTHAGPEEHLMKFANVKRSVNIPVIASLNAIHKDSWIEYAKKLESVGASALELNFYYTPRNIDHNGNDIENEQIAILREVEKTVKIPVIIKISPYYSNVLNFIKKLTEAGADGVILFNRLFQPDIDIEEHRNIYPYNLSTSDDQRLSLRFTALSHGRFKTSITSATGIHDWRDSIKMLLAGANAFQIVSTVYKNGINQITKINEGIKAWMDVNEYETIEQFRGKLSQQQQKDPYAYLRAQYIDILLTSGDVFKQNMPI